MANRYFSSKKAGPKITFKLLRAERKSLLEQFNDLDFSQETSVGRVASRLKEEGLSAVAANFKNTFSVNVIATA